MSSSDSFAVQVMRDNLNSRLPEFALQMEDVNTVLTRCNADLEDAAANGEIQMVQELYYKKISVLQKLATVAEDKCRTIGDVIRFAKPPMVEEEEAYDTGLREVTTASSELVQTVGQFAFKKECRIENINNQLVDLQCQLQLCIDRLDPTAKKHANEKKELASHREMIEEELQTLRDRRAIALATYEKYAEKLRQRQPDAVIPNPVEEAEMNNLKRKTEILEYKQYLRIPEEAKIKVERDSIADAQQRLMGGDVGSAPLVDVDYPGLKADNDRLRDELTQVRRVLGARIKELEDEVVELKQQLVVPKHVVHA